ncbi:O-antigen ligase family protein [Falsiroseomonas oryziterrae]|uniref:O-antigen ligase family protein n=1 Tax=Falsiroseomonas oryziterrae TaxID=2911368 RepID=UPI001F2D02E0|nr:O-antigen ligase family protein [Roseomonas sp. NPKOSM-4]
MTAFLRSPCFPVALLLALGPAVAVAQFRTFAPMVPVILLLAVIAHWRIHRRLPWPRMSPLLALSLALAAWGVVASVWSPELLRGVETAAALGALAFLGAAAAQALSEDTAENRRRLGRALVIGLVLGIALLAFDHASQNLFRRAVRGFPTWTPFIGFGLKPAVSILALLLPLVLAVPGLSRIAKAAILLPGLAVALWLPGESAKIAAVAGVIVALLATLAPRAVARLSAAALAVVFIAAPLLFTAALARAPDLSPLPVSAAHRVLIWDFVGDRIAERPLLGWGMESSRAIPGGTQTFDRGTLDRFGLDSPAERAGFAVPNAQRLPLHPHNNALQVWLELGLVGAVIAAALGAAAMLAAGAIGPAALGVAVSAAVTGQLSFGAWQPWWVAAMIFAAAVIAGLAPRRA